MTCLFSIAERNRVRASKRASACDTASRADPKRHCQSTTKEYQGELPIGAHEVILLMLTNSLDQACIMLNCLNYVCAIGHQKQVDQLLEFLSCI